MVHFDYDWLGSVAAFYVYAAGIHSLPEPREDERWYGAFYKFLHFLGANWKQAGLVK